MTQPEQSSSTWQTGYDCAIRNVLDYLRSDEAEQVRIRAEAAAIPPEDALAHEIERLI